MKKRSVFFQGLLLYCCITTQAQPVKLGIKGQKSEAELLTTGPKFNDANRYFKNVPFTLKAGQGIVFIMQSTAFTPLVFLTGRDGKAFGTQRVFETDNAKEARVSFIAQKNLYGGPKLDIPVPADSSFQVVFTSQEDNATGKFTYGFKLIDSSQMVFDDNSFCSRLYYLINHWQAGWDILPESIMNPVPNSGISNFCLLPSKELFSNRYASISRDFRDKERPYRDTKRSYKEILLSSSSAEASEFYTKMTDDIKNCLGEKNWTFETEVKLDNSLHKTEHISYFYTKGATKDQRQASFKIVRTVPMNDVYKNEILLVFD